MNDRLAAPSDSLSHSRRGEQWIVVVIDETSYVIRSAWIRQIEMVDKITPVPNTPEFVAGVAYARGEVIPVVDLRARFGLSPAEIGLATRIVVTDVGGRRIGLLVDRAREVAYFEESAILPPLEMASGGSGYVNGILTTDDQIFLVLDIEKVTRIEPA